MMHTVLPAFAAAALLSSAASAPAVGQTYNPYITIDVPESSKAGGKTGSQEASALSLRGKGKEPKSGAPGAYGSYRLVFPTTKSDPKKRRLQAR